MHDATIKYLHLEYNKSYYNTPTLVKMLAFTGYNMLTIFYIQPHYLLKLKTFETVIEYIHPTTLSYDSTTCYQS